MFGSDVWFTESQLGIKYFPFFGQFGFVHPNHVTLSVKDSTMSFLYEVREEMDWPGVSQSLNCVTPDLPRYGCQAVVSA